MNIPQRIPVVLGFIAIFCVLVFGFVAGSSVIRRAWNARGASISVTNSSPVARLSGETLTQEAPNPRDEQPTSTRPTTILFAGDIMLDRNVKIRSQKAGSRGYPFANFPQSWVDSFDYAVANLEGPVTPVRRPPEKSIDFQFDPEVLPALKETGFDAFSQANNHALDQGHAGYEDSLRLLREAGFTAFGHQVQDGMPSLATTTIQGTTFAFFGWNTTDNPLDRQAAAETIRFAGTQATYRIAYLHWGPEYRDRPHQNEQELAHWLIDQGIDVVIGGHPHWVQGISSYKGKPIVWSLGNFVFDQDFSLPTKQGLAVGLAFADGRVSVDLHPVRIIASQVSLETDENKQIRLDALAKISDAPLQDAVRRGVVEFEL